MGSLAEALISRGRTEGEAKGRAEGRLEGEAKGRAEGRAEGRAAGEAEGRAEGEVRGRASILNRLLERRFGNVPSAVRARVWSAPVHELDAWLDGVLDAPTLDAVFEDTPRH